MFVIINVFQQERDGCRRILDTYDNSFSSNYDPQIHARLQEVGNISLGSFSKPWRRVGNESVTKQRFKGWNRELTLKCKFKC